MKQSSNIRESKKMNNFIILLNYRMILIRLIMRNTSCKIIHLDYESFKFLSRVDARLLGSWSGLALDVHRIKNMTTLQGRVSLVIE